MKKQLLLIFSIIYSVIGFSQQLKVTDFHKDLMDTDASNSKYSKLYDGEYCGLIKLWLSPELGKPQIKGKDIVDFEYRDGRWWIYAKKNTKTIIIKVNNYEPIEYKFTDYIESSSVYIMTIERFETEKYKVEITATKSVNIYIDGLYIDKTPVCTKLTEGKHIIEARYYNDKKKKYKIEKKKIKVRAGKQNEIYFKIPIEEDVENVKNKSESKKRETQFKPKEVNKNNENLNIEKRNISHEYVDLGLSVKWATCNVGANAPHEYGNYYAWGETTTKTNYSDNNSKIYRKNMSDISGNSNYDAARANWGGSWRMPTEREMEELKNKCTWTWTSQSGVKGYKVTGPNGNSIFLPAVGYCDGSSRGRVGEDGYYWSSTPYYSSDVYCLYFSSNYRSVNWRHNYYLGRTVRPVSDNAENTNYSRVNTRVNTYQNTQEISENKTFTVNGVTFTMIAVEGGTYTMGATSEQGSDAWDDERPAHKETVSDFMIGETEVTQELWQAVMGSNPSSFTGDLQRPVERVSWNDCQEFIRKLNKLTGQNFRLPSEAEWEYAARGGNRSKGYKYAGSNGVGTVAWYVDNSGGTTHRVKTRQPNELGIYDMSGNVCEWCQDKYSNDYNSPRDSGNRVLRGGSWRLSARGVRVSIRSSIAPGRRIYYDGLRLAL